MLDKFDPSSEDVKNDQWFTDNKLHSGFFHSNSLINTENLISR